MCNLRLFIVIINYNGSDDTIECVKSLQEQTYKNFEIIIIDNGSKDDSVNRIKKSCDSVTIIEATQNLGFSGGNNLGAHYAISKNADVIMFLNNDTILEKDCLIKMLSRVEKNTIICPRIMFYDDQSVIWYAGGKVDKIKGHCVSRGYKKRIKNKYLLEQMTEVATGCCLMMHKNTFQKLGNWSEEYFLYREDDDYTFRMHKSGINILYLPEAVVYHKESRSTKKIGSYLHRYYFTRNTFYLIHKYDLGVVSYCRLFLWTIVKYLCSKNDIKKYYLEAYFDFKHNKMGNKFK